MVAIQSRDEFQGEMKVEMHVLAGNCVNSNECIVQSQQISTVGFLPACFFTNSNRGWGQPLLLVTLWGPDCFLDRQMLLCNMIDIRIFFCAIFQ